VESDEFGGEELAQSIRKAEQEVDRLVDQLGGAPLANERSVDVALA
jgi:FMN-dependent NADH-azoreductase